MQVSLCIVVRNEASLVAGAIASARPVVDEIVVVDTGSGDGTQEVARAAGARVLEREWPGDLGAAHALPVEHARGDWILALDADEVLDPLARGLVPELVATGDADGYELPVRNYQYRWPFAKWRPADPTDALTQGALGYVPTNPVRLFRRRPEYRYSGRVHQTVAPSILASGGRVAPADVPIHHYGFLRFDRDKTDLYARLTRLHAEDEPDDPRAWIDFGIVLLEDRRPVAAAAAFERARALGDDGDGAFHLGTTLLQLGRPADAIGLLDDAIRNNPTDSCFFFDRADAWEARGTASDMLGRPNDAEEAYRTAIRLRPESPAALVGLATVLSGRGGFPDADEMLGRLMRRYRGAPLTWSTAGLVHLRRGDLPAAERALETAVELNAGVVALMNLGLASARGGRGRRAARAYSAAAEWLATTPQRKDELLSAFPSRYRSRPRTLRSYPRDLVVAVVPRLEGGGGRVAVDGMLALADRPRLVLCQDSGAFCGLGLREELEQAGVDVVSVAPNGVRAALERTRPSLVLHHWPSGALGGPVRAGAERWVCVGHLALPMPLGYDAWVVLSPFHGRLQGHLPPERVTVVPNAVDVARFDVARPRAPGDPVTIAMVSRLDPAKFPRRLVDYLPPLDGARVVIAGLGSRRYELEPELAQSGLGRSVRFVGAVRSNAMPAFLARADIGLHVTELSEEVWGMSVLEMLAAGLPVVAEPKGNMPELVRDGHNGYLAAEPAEIAERLRLLVESPELRADLGAASRDAARRFDFDRYRTAMRKLVEETEAMPPLPGVLESAPRRSRADAPPWRPRCCYLVCATARSGSSLLCESLTSTGLVGEPDEFFEDDPLRVRPPRYGSDNVVAYLAELFERTATPNGVFGAKLSYPALERLDAALRPDTLADALPGLRYVSISRGDKLGQAISWARATQTGLWNSLDVGALGHGRPRFDRDAIAERLAEIERLEAAWERFFSASGVDPVRVTYEELVGDHEGSAVRVLRELGIAADTIWFGPRRLTRLADATSARWRERFMRERAAGGRPRPSSVPT